MLKTVHKHWVLGAVAVALTVGGAARLLLRRESPQAQLRRYGWTLPSSATNFRSTQDDSLRAVTYRYEFDLPTVDSERFASQLWCKLPPEGNSIRRCDTSGPMPRYHLDAAVEVTHPNVHHFTLALSD